MLHICRLHGIGLWDWDWWMRARSLWTWVLWWPDQWLLLFLWEGMDWKKLWNWYWWLHGKAMSEWRLLQWSSTWLSVSMSTSVQRKELWDWYQWVWSKPMSGKDIFILHFSSKRFSRMEVDVWIMFLVTFASAKMDSMALIVRPTLMTAGTFQTNNSHSLACAN